MGKNMILSNKIYYMIFLLLVSCVFLSNVNAAKIRGEYATKNIIGQEYYMKRCATCHGEGSRGGNMASIREWKKIFSNNGKELFFLHEDDDELLSLLLYIKSQKFKKESTMLLPFLQEFAYDSENIPTCN